MLEDGARAAQVDAVALLRRDLQRADGGHVDDRLGTALAKDVLCAALADVHRVQFDLLRCAGPAARIDAHHLVAVAQEARRHLAREQARDAGDEHPHLALRRDSRPFSMSAATLLFTSST